MLVGNKSDLNYRRRVTKEEGEEFAKKHNLLFIETSAKEDNGVTEAFEETAKMIIKKVDAGEIDVDSGNSGVKRGVLANGPKDAGLKEVEGGKKGCC